MRAMILAKTGTFAESDDPLVAAELPRPVPAADEVLVAVSVCGVCHTELDEIEGRCPPPRLPVVPGHEVVGRIVECGRAVTHRAAGERVGVGWIHQSSALPDENVSPQFLATGRDADGGYAEYMTVPERCAFPIPEVFTDEQAAPLLCAGAVGYRALKLSGIADGAVLGLTGFGGSAHIVLQIARHAFPAGRIFVFARDPQQRDLARKLGADWAGDTEDAPPQPLHAAIDTTPAWRPVLAALERLRPGGRLVINAIRKQADDRGVLADLSYERHLWQEKEIKTVANVTARDIEQFLPLAAEAGVRPVVQGYALEEANQALRDLKFGRIHGAKVLRVAP